MGEWGTEKSWKVSQVTKSVNKEEYLSTGLRNQICLIPLPWAMFYGEGCIIYVTMSLNIQILWPAPSSDSMPPREHSVIV